MKIEVLFPEFANLFGDCWNWRYLARCMPEAEMIETGYGEQPRFVSEKVDMIIMGAMTEHGQELAVKKLMPHRDRLRQLIDSGIDTEEYIDEWMCCGTMQAPMGRDCVADEQAAVILFLLSDDASYITGDQIVVDGGWVVY